MAYTSIRVEKGNRSFAPGPRVRPRGNQDGAQAGATGSASQPPPAGDAQSDRTAATSANTTTTTATAATTTTATATTTATVGSGARPAPQRRPVPASQPPAASSGPALLRVLQAADHSSAVPVPPSQSAQFESSIAQPAQTTLAAASTLTEAGGSSITFGLPSTDHSGSNNVPSLPSLQKTSSATRRPAAISARPAATAITVGTPGDRTPESSPEVIQPTTKRARTARSKEAAPSKAGKTTKRATAGSAVAATARSADIEDEGEGEGGGGGEEFTIQVRAMPRRGVRKATTANNKGIDGSKSKGNGNEKGKGKGKAKAAPAPEHADIADSDGSDEDGMNEKATVDVTERPLKYFINLKGGERSASWKAAQQQLLDNAAANAAGRKSKTGESEHTLKTAESSSAPTPAPSATPQPAASAASESAPSGGGPRVKVVNGRIVVDQESITVSQTDGTSGGVDESLGIVDESMDTRIINQNTYLKRKAGNTRRWTTAETEHFYFVLQRCGSDFTDMMKFFSNRNRYQLVNKFKNEEKKNPSKITRALMNPIFERPTTRFSAEADAPVPIETPVKVQTVNDAVSTLEPEKSAEQQHNEQSAEVQPSQQRAAGEFSVPDQLSDSDNEGNDDGNDD